jgi:hypothetical protein
MNNKLICDKWTSFINKYKNHFMSNEEKWDKKLELIKNYIDKYEKQPSRSDKKLENKQLSLWINKQQQNYKKKIGIMNNKLIYDQWTEFISKYKNHFMSNEEAWIEKLELVKNHIDKYEKLPSPYDKKLEIKQLGKWVENQIYNYKTKEQIMANKWTQFIDEHKNHFMSNEEIWNSNLIKLKKYINENNEKPSKFHKKYKILSEWCYVQTRNYKTKEQIMANKSTYDKWTQFIDEYKNHFMSNEEIWNANLIKVIDYIDENEKKPHINDKDIKIKQLGAWINTQQNNYKTKKYIMKNETIYNKWTDFITDKIYAKYFKFYKNIPIKIIQDKPTKKSTTIKPISETLITKETEKQKHARELSEYQEISKKMTIQKSETTQMMFKDDPDLWHKYHDKRDFSFKGYDKQNEIPVNKIISYLEAKKNYKLSILDLGCGRNLIKEHFKDNKKFNITGYDHVSFNGSKEADISNLPEEDDSVKMCIYSQSLMGCNWKNYLNEGKRVLECNG